jgi:arabinose-5-phosphate isomerase
MKNEEIIAIAKKVIEDESAAVLTLVDQINRDLVDAARLMLDCQGQRDVLIALSKGGQTKEVITLAKVAKARGAKLIALTEKPESELSKISDVVLKVVAPPDVDPYGMVATGSSLVNAAFGDALCVVLLNMRGYSVEEFGGTHPGGAVGKKLRDLDFL